MNKELTEKLLKKYDYLFFERESGKLTGLMQFGFACEDGWFDILDCLFEELASEIIAQENHMLCTEQEIERIKTFLNKPKLSDAQTQDRANLLKKLKKAAAEGEKEEEAEIKLKIQLLDEALQRLADDELKRYEKLTKDLEDYKKSLEEAKANAPKISQVKEKFGTLQVYGNFPEKKFAAVSLAERLSSRTCEQCGMPGKLLVMEHLYATLCMPHAQERSKGRPIKILD